MDIQSEPRFLKIRRLDHMVRVVTIVAIASLALAPRLRAASTSVTDARLAVSGWLDSDADPLGTRLGRAVERVETFADEANQPLYYVAYLEPQGYVVVSADDRVEPIVAFSASGIYDPSTTRPLGALVTNDLTHRVTQARLAHPKFTRDHRDAFAGAASSRTAAQRKWDTLMGRADRKAPVGQIKAIDRTEDIEDLRIRPLLQLDPNDKDTWLDWGQRGYAVYRRNEAENRWAYAERYACFNYYTPPADPYDPATAGDGDNYPTGCVATALALLLRYHQWPVTAANGIDPGSGEKRSFTIHVTTDEVTTPQEVPLLGGSGDNGAYNWDNMPARPFVHGLQEAHCREIGALCYDTGVAVRMSYGPTGSGAWTENIKPSLVDVFRYANAVVGLNDDGRSLAAGFHDMVNPNLDSGHPVVLGIVAEDNSGGHAVVCDGYGYHHETLYHHLNTGWVDTILFEEEDGALTPHTVTSDDAWYALPDVNDMDQVTVDFDSLRVCIYNVFPERSGEIISGRVLDKSGAPARNEVAYLRQSGRTVDTCLTDVHGIYAFVGCDSDTLYTVSVPDLDYTGLTVRTGTSVDYTTVSGNRWGIDLPRSRSARRSN